MLHFIAYELADRAEHDVDDVFDMFVVVCCRLPCEETREGVRITVPFRGVVSVRVEGSGYRCVCGGDFGCGGASVCWCGDSCLGAKHGRGLLLGEVARTGWRCHGDAEFSRTGVRFSWEGVGVVRNRSDRDAERNREGSNNKEVERGQRDRRWKHRGVMKLQRVFPAKSVVGIKTCSAGSKNLAGGGEDNRLRGEESPD